MVYWLVEQQTHKVQALLVLGFLSMGAHWFSGLGGVWADQYETTSLLKGFAGITALMLGITSVWTRQTHQISVMILMIIYGLIVSLQNASASLFRTAPLQWVPKSQWPSLNALNGIVGRLAVMASGLLDLLIFHFSMSMVWRFAFPAGAAVFAGLLWMPLGRATIVTEMKRQVNDHHFESKLNRHTLAEIWQLSAFRNLTLLLALANVFAMPFLHLLPAWSGQILHTGNQGYFSFKVSDAVGLLAGYGISYWLSKKAVTPMKGVRIGLLLQLVIFSFPWLRGLWLPLAAVTLMGISDGIQDTYIISLLQRYVPDDMQGRMFGILTLIVGGIAGPVGLAIVMGLSLELSLEAIFIVSSIGIGLVTLVLLRYSLVPLHKPGVK